MPRLSIACGLLLIVCLAIPVSAGSLPDAPSVSSQVPDAIAITHSLGPENTLTIQPPPEVFAARRMLRQMPVSGEFLIQPAQKPRGKVMDRNFLLLAGMTFAFTAADIELTQHCLREKTCIELNPTLPLSRWGMYATNTPVNLAVLYWSYKRKQAGKFGWWIAPLVDIGIHGVGIGSNVRFAW